jgi:putative ABC transport system permease protein
LKDLSGNDIEGGKTVMSNSVASRFNLEKGDTVTLVNNSNLKSYTVTVDEIADINLGDYIYMDMNELNTMLELSENTYIGMFSSKKLDIDENLLLSERTKAEAESGMVDFVDLYRNLLYILAAFAAVIGIIVIYIVTVMLITENSKNISMLKVVGYYNREISSLLLNSNTVPLLLGIIAGIPLSKVLMQEFFNEMTANVYLAFEAQLKFINIIFTLIFILAIYYITLLISRKKVLKINMAESLKGRE